MIGELKASESKGSADDKGSTSNSSYPACEVHWWNGLSSDGGTRYYPAIDCRGLPDLLKLNVTECRDCPAC